MASHRTTPFRRSSSSPASTVLRRPRPSSSTLSDFLADERLREHARRNGVSAVSSYYRSLTDTCLNLRSHGRGGESPDRESLGSSASARSFSSTILVRIHHLGTSCFSKRRTSGEGPVAAAKAAQSYPRGEPWDPGLPARGGKEAGSRTKSVARPEGKPLRESDPAPAKVSAPPNVAIGTLFEISEESSAAMSSGSVEREYVWAHMYRPWALKEFICNREQAAELQQLAIKQQCSHFIFEGPPGVGKGTMVLAFLREIFGPGKLKTKIELKKIELKGELVASIDLNVKISSKHIEVNLSEVLGYEKHVISTLINESHTPVDKDENCDHTNSQAIVLHEAENLPTDSQHYVRWLMEKYTGCNRIFFCCSDVSKLHTVKHLCKIIKLQPPSDSEIVEVLEFIAKKENIGLPHHLAEKIAKNSKHNLRQAIRSFEASWKSTYSLKENQEILTGWEEDIATTAKNIIEEQSPKQLYIIRGKLKNLIEHNVSADFIFSTLIAELKKHLDDQLQTKIDTLYQEYNNRDNKFFLDADKSRAFSSDTRSGKRFHDPRKNVQHFMRIEEFAAEFMSFYKSAMTQNTGGRNCQEN